MLSLAGNVNALRNILLYHFSEGIIINGGLEAKVTNLLKSLQGKPLQLKSVRAFPFLLHPQHKSRNWLTTSICHQLSGHFETKIILFVFVFLEHAQKFPQEGILIRCPNYQSWLLSNSRWSSWPNTATLYKKLISASCSRNLVLLFMIYRLSRVTTGKSLNWDRSVNLQLAFLGSVFFFITTNWSRRHISPDNILLNLPFSGSTARCFISSNGIRDWVLIWREKSFFFPIDLILSNHFVFYTWPHIFRT